MVQRLIYYCMLIGGLLLWSGTVGGQELNMEVTVNAQQIGVSDKSVFNTLEEEVQKFMNSRKWIDDKFKENERIDCNMLITVNSYNSSTHKFTASATIQSNRPVYNASYQSLLLNQVDENFSFEYQEFQPIVFNENSFKSNLSSLLAYYAYLIIGLDYDTFGKLDGTPYFEKAKTIVNNAQSSGKKGWSPDDSKQKNRYWIIESLLNPNLEPYRKANYKYHRKGLDMMYDKAEKGRQNIFSALQQLNKVYQQRPQSVLFQIFFSAKYDELIGIFQEARPTVKQKAVQLLSKMDASHSKEYRNILK